MKKQGGVVANTKKTQNQKTREADREAMSRAYHTGHDNWGPCCWNCQWHGEATKPCHCCEEWREALR